MIKQPNNLEELRFKKLLLKQELKFKELEIKRQNTYLSQNKFKIFWKEFSPFTGSKSESKLGLVADLLIPGLLGALGINKVSGNRILVSLAQVLIAKLAGSGISKIFKKKSSTEAEVDKISNEESDV